MNDFNDGRILAAHRRRMTMAPVRVTRHADINELVDKTRIAVDRAARAYGRF